MDQSFFIGNRQRLWDTIPQDEAVVVLFSGLPRRRTADEDYPFYASRSFVYLTGLEKEDLVYLARKKDGKWEETLFLPDTDPMQERWTGRMLHAEQVEPRSGITQTRSRTAFDAAFRRMIAGMACPTLWLDFDLPAANQQPEPAQTFAAAVQQQYPWCRIANCHPALQRLRSVKQPEELEDLRRSIQITHEGIRAMLKACKPGMYEYQLRAEFEKVLADRGVREPAFDTIVGAGKNALVMHYPEQDGKAEDGDLVLIDLGAQWGYCGADISRVFPANGHFTDRQKQMHHASVATIEYLLEHVKPGMPITDVDRLSHEHLQVELEAMGLMTEGKTVRDYLWHSVTHHLGFDIHDDNDYSMPLTPGMVITMEVGVYVEDWGEGVRVEEDVLITPDGCENLSREIIRSVEDIEAAMAE